MKTVTALIGTGSLAALLCVGCQKSSESPAPDTTTPPSQATGEVSLEKTVTDTAETAKKVMSEANAKAQEILTQAQNLVGEKKYDEAANLLEKLRDFKLTPEQQKMLDDLKATIQKAMESEAVKQGTKAIGNVLGGEK